MRRDRYNPVTPDFRLPILIPSIPEEQEGVATFESEFGPPKPVRMFKNSDLKNARKHLSQSEAQGFYAVVALTQGLQNPADSIALGKAKAAFDEWHRLQQDEPSIFSPGDPGYEVFANGLARIIGLPPEEAIAVFDGKRPGPRAAADPRWLLSYQISQALSSDAHLVLWCTGTRLTPAIWCEDVKTAFYVRALLNVTGGKGLRICPHCSEPFLQERPDQNYCSIAHREAHRVARWRARHKLEPTTKIRRKRNVPRKKT